MIIRAAAAVAFAAVASVAFANDTGQAVKSRSYLQNFRDLALSRCIATAYKSSPDAARDAAASAGGLFEWSNFDVEAGGATLDALIARTLAQTYGSFQGPSVRLDLMKCFDLYHGPALAALARKVVARPNRTWLRDNPER